MFRQDDKFYMYIKEKKGKYKHIGIKPISRVNQTEMLEVAEFGNSKKLEDEINNRICKLALKGIEKQATL